MWRLGRGLAIIGRYMRRTLVSILFLIGLVALLTLATGAWAGSLPLAQPAEPLVVVEPPGVWLADEIVIDELELLSPDAAPAADTCSTATPLTLAFGQTADGSGTLTNSFTEEVSDPIPACTFGTPVRATGFRTA